jgi:hypothetical protein
MQKCHESEWAAPTFIQPKKTGNVRVLTDFRQLNKYLKCRPFPYQKYQTYYKNYKAFD